MASLSLSQSVMGMSTQEALQDWFDKLDSAFLTLEEFQSYAAILENFQEWYTRNASNLPALTESLLCFLLYLNFNVAAEKTKFFMQTDWWINESQKFISRCNDHRMTAFASPRSGVMLQHNETPYTRERAQYLYERRMEEEEEERRRLAEERRKEKAEKARNDDDDDDDDDNDDDDEMNGLLTPPGPNNNNQGNQPNAAFGLWSPDPLAIPATPIPASQTQLENAPVRENENENENENEKEGTQDLEDFFNDKNIYALIGALALVNMSIVTMEALGGGIACEIRREIAVMQFNTSLIIAELKHLRQLVKKQGVGAGRKRKALSIDSEDEDGEETLSSETDEEEERQNKHKPRRSKRHQTEVEASPEPSATLRTTAIDYAEIRGDLRLHKDDGPYIIGFMDAESQTGMGPTARIRWLKPFNSDPDCRTFVFCDWPAQIVDLINSSTRSAVGTMTHSGQMVWDHTEGEGEIKRIEGFGDAPFEVLPYLYEYGSGTTTDFTHVLKYMCERAGEKLLGRDQKTQYLMGVLDRVCECYDAPGFLYAFGTRTESDHEANIELAHMACQTRGATLSTVLTPCTSNQTVICDCCNKRSRKVASLMHIDACGTCCRKFCDLVSITDAVPLTRGNSSGKNGVCAAFARLMYVLADILV